MQLNYLEQNVNNSNKNYAKAVIILDVNNLEQCKINYLYRNQTIEKDELNEKFLNIGFTDDEKLSLYWSYFGRFFEHGNYVIVKYSNHSFYNKIPKYLKYSIISSIDTDRLLRGLFEMVNLSDSCGGHTPLYIKYSDNEVLVSEGRNLPITVASKKLIYDFAYNNNLKIEGININMLSFEEFLVLFDYVDLDMYNWMCGNYYGPEEYGNILHEKVKNLNLRNSKC